MRLLVLGGSVFLGRHILEAALQRGHQITVFNRGSRALETSGPVEQVRGDRMTDLHLLAGREFDSVIDCCGYTAEHLQLAVAVLAPIAHHYVFVSTISVLQQFSPGVVYDEHAARTKATTGYGGLKARAEETIEAGFSGRVAQVRPGLIVGPHDPTGRFAYWPLRLHEGGTVLAPGRPQRPVQFIDGRDLAAWCVLLAEQHTAGIFHAVGPTSSMEHFLQQCRAVCQPEGQPPVQFVWRDDDTLTAADVAPWTGLPLWIPESDPDFGGMLLADGSKARNAGLTTRPWADTLRDTLAWALAQPESAVGEACMKRDVEASLIR